MCSLPSGFFNATRFGDVARKISPSVWKWGFFPVLKTTYIVQCMVIVRCLVIRDIYSTNIFYKTWGNKRLYTNQSYTGARKCIQENSGHTHRGRVLRATKNWHHVWSWSLTFTVWVRISREADGLETRYGSCESTSHLSQRWQVSIRYR